MTGTTGTTARTTALLASLLVACSVLVACGGDDAPTDVDFGETTVVVVVNPTVNDVNEKELPTPGSATGGLTVSTDDGISGTTDANGIAVLTGVEAGRRTLTISGQDVDASTPFQITEGELREISMAALGSNIGIMSNVGISSQGTVMEIEPSMSVADVNAALNSSNVVLFFRSGTYAGDLDFSGSDAILFGEGARGDDVIIDGDVEITGSRSRIRGVRVLRDLTLPASDSSLSFSQVQGSTTVDGSDPVLLNNDFCGGATVNGSGATAVGNVGLAPYGGC